VISDSQIGAQSHEKLKEKTLGSAENDTNITFPVKLRQSLGLQKKMHC
jgi:hypothetical protein